MQELWIYRNQRLRENMGGEREQMGGEREGTDERNLI